MTPHFTIEEFTASDTAERLGIENRIPQTILVNAEQTLLMMEKIRAALCAPIHITSGYRCLELNRAIGSKDTSDHVHANAVDFKAPDFGTPLDICKALEPRMKELGIGQLIYERSWTHVSRVPPEKAINRVITARTSKEFIPGIVEV